MRERLESISRKFHHMGTRWGEVRCLGEMPWFTPGRKAAYFRSPISAQTPRGYFEKGLARQFNRIYPLFERSEGAAPTVSSILQSDPGIALAPPALHGSAAERRQRGRRRAWR